MEARVIAHLKQDNYQTTITAGEKQILADEPVSLGGKDLGFTPYELLASSLASCTAITLRMYSAQKQWDLGQISIDITMEKDPETSLVTFIRTLSFENKDLLDKQLLRLESVAGKCPVHKILSSQINIQTSIA
ncbi:OsmC family protein [Myroides sp. LJL119]